MPTARPHEETIVALATPSGESAVALVRVSGGECARLAREIFGRVPPPRAAAHADYRDRAGALVDDVLFTYFAGPASYTGEDVMEIGCHGSPYIAERVLEDLVARGARMAEPGEFTKRAFLNGRMDLSQAEAVMDLIHARSERALEAANRQLRGALGKQIAAAIERLVGIVAQVEAYIDFPEEDLPAEDRGRLHGEVAALRAELERLLATAHYGALLRDGVRAVIVGEPNAGKSSLLNRLVGWDRALVSPEPGTTRDYLEEARVLGAHKVRFVDTAGLNATPGALEARGIERTLERAAEADLFLVVLDATRPCPTLPATVADRLTVANTVVVWNKRDLAGPGTPPVEWAHFSRVEVSALTGGGVEDLESAISGLIDNQRITFDGDIIAINARHAGDLAEATQCLAQAEAKLGRRGGADELMASDLRGALDALGRIGGRVDHERILDKLFASFCIGK
ncbi:MAG TPA: tRNA uridine-5-carboxymethylaminomethyl(34) synthesis GTPase MnmE [Opitutaceae bacterium]|nr:tRNA uridine-5-carboxymethylaminomethyl(34) synthesis GTPase MnmE [Opitutaceae bacterium]